MTAVEDPWLWYEGAGRRAGRPDGCGWKRSAGSAVLHATPQASSSNSFPVALGVCSQDQPLGIEKGGGGEMEMRELKIC